jgi:hypothetical protein
VKAPINGGVSKTFPRNEGYADRAIRLAAGVVLVSVGLLVLGGLQASVVGLVVAAIGFLSLVTGASGRCPGYVPFGISTVRERHGAAAR